MRHTARRFGIRDVEERDVPAVVALVHELAEYERAAEHCHLTAAQLHAALFGPSPALFGHVAEVHEAEVQEAEVQEAEVQEAEVHEAERNDGPGYGTVVGCALWFRNFSTWRGVHGLYLEDLYVQPAHRGAGLGRALLARLAAVCAQRGLERLEWSVLDWNAPSIGFYRALGAVPMDEWTTFRLDGAGLAALARDDTDDPVRSSDRE